jgi:hypothetical protein
MSNQAPAQGDPKSGSKRSKLLIVILVVLLAALAYDYVVARPNVDSAYDRIAEKSVEVNANTTEVFTDADVQELLGRKPSRTFNDVDGDRVEVYSWRAGLPFRTHDLFVVYKPNEGRQLFYRHAKFAYESSVDVSPITGTRVVEVGDIDEMTEEEYEQAMMGGGGGGDDTAGGAEGGSRGDARGRMDPAAMFEERDSDGDGQLKGDEIPDRARENMEEIDTDKDGAISNQEWMARMQAMRARRSGSGSRPEMDEGEDASDESTAEEPTAEKPAANEPPAEKPAPEKPAGEEAAAEEPTADPLSSENTGTDSPPK